jgi:hypothetical protein
MCYYETTCQIQPTWSILSTFIVRQSMENVNLKTAAWHQEVVTTRPQTHPSQDKALRSVPRSACVED